jgi:hypothetical protein
MALLEGKTTILVVTQLGEQITLQYPPLFHLLSLCFFLAFPTVDPYLIMKLIVSALDSLQIFPIYYTVRYVSKSPTGATIAALLVMMAPSDFHMISWGGYANVAALLLMAILVYVVLKEKPLQVGLISTALFLTHHLSMLFAIAVLFPYFLLAWWQTGKVPRCLPWFLGSMALAYGLFYRDALIPLFDLYTKYAPRYAEFILPETWPQMLGPLVLVLATAGLVLQASKTRMQSVNPDQLLAIWLVWPILLGYAYVFGVQWHSIRWIYFLLQPACVWSGIAVAHLRERKLVLIIVLFCLVLQWIGTMQGYYSDVAYNSGYNY